MSTGYQQHIDTLHADLVRKQRVTAYLVQNLAEMYRSPELYSPVFEEVDGKPVEVFLEDRQFNDFEDAAVALEQDALSIRCSDWDLLVDRDLIQDSITDLFTAVKNYNETYGKIHDLRKPNLAAAWISGICKYGELSEFEKDLLQQHRIIRSHKEKQNFMQAREVIMQLEHEVSIIQAQGF